MNSQKTAVMVIILAILGTLAFYFAGANFPPFVGFLVGVVATVLVIAFANRPVSASSSSSASNGGDSDRQTLYVGNLPYKANESHVRELFSQHGEVLNVRLMKDKRTGKRRGFGFVIVAKSDAKKVIKQLNDYDYMERSLKVRVANDPKHPEGETDQQD